MSSVHDHDNDKLFGKDLRMMTIDLNEFKLGDWLRLRSGGLWRPGVVRRCADPYCWDLGDMLYTNNGTYYEDDESPRDIVEIIPAERITFVEWIADRRPELADATDNCVLIQHDSGSIRLWPLLAAAESAKPWAHCPGWAPPADGKDAKIARLEATVAALESRLRGVER